MSTAKELTYHQKHYLANKEKYQASAKARYQQMKIDRGIQNRKVLTIVIGARFGRWVVIVDPKQRDSKSKMLCIVQCDCGTVRTVVFANLINGISTSCGCYALEQRRTANGLGMLNNLFSNYARKAKSVQRAFTLTKDQFHVLTQQTCFYCGIAPNRTISKPDIDDSYTYNGIDRVNNDLGYTLDNCVTCCAECNKAKHTMTAQEFIALCNRVTKLHVLD